MAKRICIIGLGNPGRKYERTRHSVGFEWIDRISESFPFEDSPSGFTDRFEAHWCERRWKDWQVHLLKPQTYMNLSGTAVRQWKSKFQGESDFLVVYDELDFEAGQIKLRPQGSHGGHNGMASIIEALGTRDFPRLRIGIGRPAVKEDVSNYVLTKFAPEDRKLIESLLEKAPDYLEVFLDKGMDAAMNVINGEDFR